MLKILTANHAADCRFKILTKALTNQLKKVLLLRTCPLQPNRLCPRPYNQRQRQSHP